MASLVAAASRGRLGPTASPSPLPDVMAGLYLAAMSTTVDMEWGSWTPLATPVLALRSWCPCPRRPPYPPGAEDPSAVATPETRTLSHDVCGRRARAASEPALRPP